MKLALAGVPMVPISRVAGAMFLAATDEEPGSHGAVYSLPDEREVFRVPHVELNEGVYQIMNDRAKRAKRWAPCYLSQKEVMIDGVSSVSKARYKE